MNKKKVLLFSFAALLSSSTVMAQGWKVGGNALTATGKIGSTSNQDVQFISNNVVNGVLSKTGFWGLGTTAPSAKLHINSATGQDALRVQINGATRLKITANGGVSVGGAASAPSDGLSVFGSVGIGTNTPLSKLHVQTSSSGISPFSLSAITAESSTSTYINLLAPSASETGILFGNSSSNVSGGIIYNSSFASPAPNGLQFRTNGNFPRMVLNKDGFLNVGPGVNDDYRVRIDHNGVLGLDIASTSIGTDWEIFAGSSGLNLFVDGGAGGAKGIFNRSTGVYSALSDERAKTNIKPMANVLEKISLLKPTSYQFKNVKDQQEYDGFIAQDVIKVFPNLVTHNAEPKRNVDQYLLNYSGFGVIAVKAIQEMLQVIKEQDARIAALEAKTANASAANAVSTDAAQSKINTVVGASLEQNQPNPFNSNSIIRYQIPQGSKAQLHIYNASGALIKTFVANESGQTTINAGELSAGTYTYTLIVNGKPTASKKMVLMK